jgi:putative addiction module killer protein
MIQLLEYTAATDDSPFTRWREKMEPVTRARITVAILRMEAGNFSAAKSVGGGVSELRLDFGPG